MLSPLTGEILSSRFRLAEEFGRGGMGVVYRAIDRDVLGRKVALKIIRREFASNPEYREGFIRETAVALELKHPHLVPVYCLGTMRELFVASEFIESLNLAERLQTSRRLSLTQTINIAGQVASALEALHQVGLIHGNLTPRNVLVAGRSGRESVLVTDFGLARFSTPALRNPSSAAFAGSLPYCSPERFRGEPAGRSSDVYALACLVVECLTGRLPFPGPAHRTYSQQHQSAPIPRLASLAGSGAALPASLDDVVSWGLEKDPALRPSSPASWLAALEDAAALASPAGPAVRVQPARPRRYVTPLPLDPQVVATTHAPSGRHSPGGKSRSVTRAPAGTKPVIPNPLLNGARRPPLPVFAYAKPRIKTRLKRRPPKWTGAGLAIIVGLGVAVGFSGGSAGQPSPSATATAGRLQGTTSKSGSAVASNAADTRLIGAAGVGERTLFNRVSQYALGTCRKLPEVPFINPGWMAAISCKPSAASSRIVTVRQFKTVKSATADAKARSNGKTLIRAARGVCNPANQASMASPGYSVISTETIPRQTVASYASCFVDSGSAVAMWVYKGSAIQMGLEDRESGTRLAVRFSAERLDADVRPYLQRSGG